MNGPSHYAKAESLLSKAEEDWHAGDEATHDARIAAAQVHATLALASTAAVRNLGLPGSSPTQWQEVMG